MNFIRDKLWSEYGIRSLSQSDEFFGKGDNYWRGPVWVQMNYLVLRGLYKFYRGNDKASKLYADLRENIINTVCVNWRDTGYFFEHYNQRGNGKGGGYHPFSISQ